MKTLLVIQHSHTDVGYTEPQGRIARWHADFIRQALAIVARPECQGFKWTCETFWGVEQFLESASPAEREAFAAACRAGLIGVSASYLNFSELADFELLRATMRRAVAWGESAGVRVDSAMVADINGVGWGFARAMRETGVENLFACVHTHHGMYPLGRTQVGFFWEAPDGGRVLVWSGEHYHFGNELGLVPGAAASYLTKDECDAAAIFGDPWRVAETRIRRYFEKLAAGGYALDFAPVMLSGLRTDNGPPNAATLDQIRRWNAAHGDEVLVEMATLSEFFARLRATGAEFPVWRGDWPDWWTDGPAGDPETTRLFREAQRGLRVYEALPVPHEPVAGLETDLALYAEHTFSHSDSMGSPWHPLVTAIAARKKAFAARAFDRANDLLDGAALALGGACLRPGMPLLYRVLNPADHAVRGPVRLSVGHHEYHELSLDRGGVVCEAATGAEIPSQREFVPRGADFVTFLTLPARGEIEFVLAPGAPAAAPGVFPARVEWSEGAGITGFTDLATGRSLLRTDRPHAPLSLVYERTPMAGRDDACRVRGAMGLNRKGPDVERSVARLARARRSEAGPVFRIEEFEYDAPGCRYCAVEARSFAAAPRIDFAVRMLKEARWEPENVYLPLPFAPGDGPSELWIGKAGAVLRPRRDQLPGTLTDYYSLEDGFAVTGEGFGVAVALPDANLLQVGALDHGPRRLAGDPALAGDPEHLYSWLMTNYWETNFSAELGGFYEFRVSVAWGPELADPGAAIRAARDMNRGLFVVRRGE